MSEASATTGSFWSHVRKSPYWRKLIKTNITAMGDNCIVHGRLDPHKIFDNLDEIREFYSGHDVHPSRIMDNENFARWAIDEALREYQPESSFRVTGNAMEEQHVITEGKAIPKELSDAIQADGQRDVDVEDANGGLMQEVNAAAEVITAASPNSLGPPIEACVSYLRMEKCGTFGRNGLTIWKSKYFPRLDNEEGRKGFLDNQITAIVWILANFLGRLPLLKPKFQEYYNPDGTYTFPEETEEQKKHRKMLQRPQYFGAILADSMGLGKTLTTIACLELIASQHLNIVRAGRNRNTNKCRPMLILAPNSIVASQWVDEIESITSAKGIKRILVSGDGIQRSEGQRRTRVLSAKEFREWPAKLDYVWDRTDPKAAKTIIVMSIDTFASRTCSNKEVDDEGEVKEGNWYSKFTRMGRGFSVVVVDEAYKIRHTQTRYWKSVALLEREFTLLITATPCMNLITDLLGPVRLLWQKAEEHLKENGDRWQKMDRKIKEPQDLRVLEGMSEHDDYRLIAGRPSVMAKLIQKYKNQNTMDIQETRNFLKYYERLAILRRAPSSSLYWDWERTKLICLDGLLPNVQNFTVNIQLDSSLEELYQYAHIDELITYMETVKKIWKKTSVAEEEKKIQSLLTSNLRFELAASSMDIYRLEDVLSLNGFGIKAEYVHTMRQTHVNFMHLAPFLLGPYDAEPRTALDYIKLAVRNSPILRYILHHVKEKLLDRKPNEKIKKVLIIESRPILAFYYELVLQFLLINCKTLHAGLSGEQRRELISSFNGSDDHSCQVLIQMYSVGFAGSNLHKSCSQVIVASQAHSFPVQLQAVHRVIRVGQTEDVQVYRLKVNNSYHQFRESRQVEKILPELGTRAQGPMVGILVQLLNLFQYEIEEAVNSLEGQKLMRDMNLLTDEIMTPGTDINGGEDEGKGTNQAGEQNNEEEPDSQGEEPARKRPRLENQSPSQAGNPDQDPKKEEQPSDIADSEADAFESDTESHDSDLSLLREEGTAHLFDHSRKEFLRLKPRTAYYKEFKNFPGEVKSHFSHEKNNLRRLLSFMRKRPDGTTREWTADDLNDSAVLERAMELTLRVRLGADNISMLPSPHIGFTRVPERKIRRLTELLGQAELTAEDIDKIIAKKREAKTTRGDSRSELRGVENYMTLSEIDELFREDVVKGDTAQSRKRKLQESQGAQVARASDAANDEALSASEPNEPPLDENFWDESDGEEGSDGSKTEDDDNEDNGDGHSDSSDAEEPTDGQTIT
ncbi:SNF2 family N-terminal domain-containing protein [Rostrohypoxylon terebratum]|nr:SNF2 family N-terminal domain-containing protein [Rostrohypoxylon terebratum]